MRLSVAALVCTLVCVGCSLDRIPRSRDSQRKGTAGVSGTANGGASGVDGTGNGGAGVNAGGAGLGANAGAGGTGGLPTAGAGADPCGGCDDGVFCNGAETCAPSEPTADARGCITSIPCLPEQSCDEALDMCTTQCAVSKDADFDGFDAISCGGDDCNDAAPTANPNGVEVCDGLDNDCNGAVDDNLANWSCLRANTLASCSLGQCVVTLCNDGYADCDKSAANGCETTLDLVPGDCAITDCAGATIAAPSDLPADDGNECTVEFCSGATPMVKDAQDGTSCDSGKGNGSACVQGQCEKSGG